MTDIIEAALAEGAQDVPVAEQTAEIQPDAGEEPKKTGNPRLDDPWPDSARKALNRAKQEKQATKFELQRLKEELNQLREGSQKPKEAGKENGPPKEDEFDNYGDFIKANARWEMKQELQSFQQEQQGKQISQQEQVWTNERLGAIDKQIDEMSASIPDFKTVEDQHEDTINELVQIPHVFKAFLEADNAPLAFYALAKEGKLEALAGMSPSRVAMEIAKAELRGEALAKQKPVTNAPAPIQPAKGSGGISKTLDAMTADELRAWRKS